MKFSLSLLALLFCAIAAWGQALAPSNPVLGPGTSPVLIPGTPQTAPNPVLPPLRPGSTGTNVSTNAPQTDLRTLLVNMQDVLEATIPPLAAYNDSFDFVVATNGFSNPLTNADTGAFPGTQPPLPDPSGENLSTVLGANMSSRAGANLGGNVSSVVGASPAVTMPSVPAGSSAAPFVNTTGATTGQVTNVAPPLTTRETLRALLILQQDLEQALGLVDALNATPNIPGVNLTPTGR